MRRWPPSLLPKLKALGRATPVIVAGNPENAEELRAAGIADFVHLRSQPVEFLTKWQQTIGNQKSNHEARFYKDRLEAAQRRRRLRTKPRSGFRPSTSR